MMALPFLPAHQKWDKDKEEETKLAFVFVSVSCFLFFAMESVHSYLNVQVLTQIIILGGKIVY